MENVDIQDAFAVLNGASESGEIDVALVPAFIESEHFVGQLQGNQNVKSVNLWVEDPVHLEPLANEQSIVSKILTAVVDLPNLEELTWVGGHVESDQVNDLVMIPIAHITKLVIANPKLERFYLQYARFTGTLDDFQAFADKVATHHTTLKEFFLTESGLPPEVHGSVHESSPCLAAILGACARLPRLETLVLTSKSWQSMGELDPPSLQQVLQNQSLRTIRIDNFTLDPLILGLQRVRNDTRLQILELYNNRASSSFTQSVVTGMATLIRDDVVSSLRTIRVGLEPLEPTANDESNQRLIHFLEAMAEALLSSSLLETFHLWRAGSSGTPGSSLSSETCVRLWTEYVNMMKVNTTLKTLALQTVIGDGDSNQIQANLYAKLNQRGRSNVMGPGRTGSVESKKKWVEQLICCSDDLDCLFYFLSANPNIFFMTPATLTRPQEKRQRLSDSRR